MYNSTQMVKNFYHNKELHQKISKYYAQINHTPQRKMARLNTTNIDSRMIPRSIISIIESCIKEGIQSKV